MATLGARVDDELFDQVQKAARAAKVSVSIFLADAVKEKLERGTDVNRYQQPLFDPEARDRVKDQREKVTALMLDGQYRSLPEIAQSLNMPDSSIPAISARLRDLRKTQFGGFVVDKRQRRPYFWEYQVTMRSAA